MKVTSYEAKAHFEKEFTATGDMVISEAGGVVKEYSMKVPGEHLLRVNVSGVGAGNTILTKARMKGASSFTTLGTITSTGEEVYDISTYDEVLFNCGVYSASGTPKVVANAFFL